VRWLNIPITAAGAIVPVEFGISHPRRQALKAAGRAVPPTIVVPMLVDTGASHTFIDSDILVRQFELTPKNRYTFHSATTQKDKPQECDCFDVSLVIGSAADQTVWRIDPFEVMASDERSGSHGLLGRDILNRVQLEWRGPSELLRMGYT
jgi:hypothetical protein